MSPQHGSRPSLPTDPATPAPRPLARQVLYNEFEANLDADNEKLDELRNQLLTQSMDNSEAAGR